MYLFEMCDVHGVAIASMNRSFVGCVVAVLQAFAHSA